MHISAIHVVVVDSVFVPVYSIRARVMVGVFDCVTNVAACIEPHTYRAVAFGRLRSNRQTPPLTHIRLLRPLGNHRVIHATHRIRAAREHFILVARYPCGVECWLLQIINKAACSNISYHNHRIRVGYRITIRTRLRFRATRIAIGSYGKKIDRIDRRLRSNVRSR